VQRRREWKLKAAAAELFADSFRKNWGNFGNDLAHILHNPLLQLFGRDAVTRIAAGVNATDHFPVFESVFPVQFAFMRNDKLRGRRRGGGLVEMGGHFHQFRLPTPGGERGLPCVNYIGIDGNGNPT
jgi:hypothetical protein